VSDYVDNVMKTTFGEAKMKKAGDIIIVVDHEFNLSEE
jgi:hypothetical protein